MATQPEESIKSRAMIRLAYVDFTRGLLMIFMALDHVSELLNDGFRSAPEFAFGATPDVSNLAAFLTRFSAVVVAPGFCFLAGTSVALLDGLSKESQPTRRLYLRGLVLLLFQLFLNLLLPQSILYGGILFCLGVSLIILTAVRKLSSPILTILAAVIILGHPALLAQSSPSYWNTILFRSGHYGSVVVYYPVLPWLGLMLLGYVIGRDLLGGGRVQKLWPLLALGSLAALLSLRIFSDYGNTFAHSGPLSRAFWLFAKYPPDLAYITWSLSLIFLSLWTFKKLEDRDVRLPEPILLFGRVAFFFYVAHFVMIAGLATMLPPLSLAAVYGVTVLLLIVLYPVCRRYLELRNSGKYPLMKYL